MFKGIRFFRKIFLTALALFLASSVTAGAEVRNIKIQELQELLKENKDEIFLLDVRTPVEYSGGRIPGAVSIPMIEVSMRVGEMPKDKKVVVVCASGGRSARVAAFLSGEGFSWVANYVGGTNEWVKKGLPVEK